MTQDVMVGWLHRLNAHEFEQAPRVGDGQGSLVCCVTWNYKESDSTEQLNCTESNLEVGLSYVKTNPNVFSANIQPSSQVNLTSSIYQIPNFNPSFFVNWWVLYCLI